MSLLGVLGTPLNGREISEAARQGCDWKGRHMWSRWFLCDSHMRANWDIPEGSGPWCALPVFICGLVCQGKCLSVCAVEKLKGHLISSPVDLYALWNCGALGGFSTPPSSGDCAVITACPGLAVYLLDAGSKHTSVPVREEPGCCLTRSGVFVSSAFECTAAQLGQKLQPPSPC